MFGIVFRREFIGLAACLVVLLAACLLTLAFGTDGLKEGAVASSSESPPTVSGAPTVDFIAAALRNQASASIEAKYSLSDWLKYHYIRTPEALSMTRTFETNGEVIQSSYDFGSRENRRLSTQTDGTLVGRVETWLGDPFVNLDCLDGALFVLPWGEEGPRPLSEWVLSGQVLPDQEDVDGHRCWRVEVSKPIKGMDRYSVWVDPHAGFCPRRIEIASPERTGPTVIKFLDYKELAAGIWFPMKQVNEIPTEKEDEKHTSIRTVSEATAGKTFLKDSLLVKFPSGTKLYVNQGTEPVTVP